MSTTPHRDEIDDHLPFNLSTKGALYSAEDQKPDHAALTDRLWEQAFRQTCRSRTEEGN